MKQAQIIHHCGEKKNAERRAHFTNTQFLFSLTLYRMEQGQNNQLTKACTRTYFAASQKKKNKSNNTFHSMRTFKNLCTVDFFENR